MSFSRRDRREWRIILWVNLSSAAISAYFGYAAAPSSGLILSSMVQGVLTSLLIATPITVYEVRSTRFGMLRRLRRLPLIAYLALKILFYTVVIANGLVLARFVASVLIDRPFVLDANFLNSVSFAIAMSVFGNMVFELGGLLGYGTLRNLLTGRYVQPRREDRTFLLIDMKNSTGLAEALGPVRFHELLNEFFRDITDAALECGAEIHKYVGDEAILTWRADTAGDGECFICPFVMRERIAGRDSRYRTRFGAVPEFRAALHTGEIVAGEIGNVRREIAYVGDTLTVAARLLDAAKESGHDVLVSRDLLDRVPLPAGLNAELLPTLTVRGRAAPLAIAALTRLSAAS